MFTFEDTMLFSEIKGNQPLIDKLVREVDSGRIPHARMLAGQEGNAKFKIALALVQLIMCENREGEKACESCKACIKNAKLIHPDVHFSFPVIPRKSGDKPTSNDYIQEFRETLIGNHHIDYNEWMNIIKAENKQGNITKEECNSIIKKLALKPFESEYKVLIMWLPEYLGFVGNALLKILEEPPQKTLFILLSEKVDFILPTILSRVQLSHVMPYTDDEVQQQLEALDVGEAAKATAFMSHGNMALALKLLNQIDAAVDPTEHFQQWMRSCFRNHVPDMMAWSDLTATMGRENIKAFLTYGLALIRESFALKLTPEYAIRYAEKEQVFIRNFSNAIHFANIETLYVEINKTIGEIERNANAKITLLNLSVQLGLAFKQQKQEQNLT